MGQYGADERYFSGLEPTFLKLELGFQWVSERSNMSVFPKLKKLVEVNPLPILTPCPNLHASRCEADVAMTSAGFSQPVKKGPVRARRYTSRFNK